MCIIFLINKLNTCFNFIKEIVFILEDMRYYFQTKFVFGKLFWMLGRLLIGCWSELKGVFKIQNIVSQKFKKTLLFDSMNSLKIHP